MPGDLAVASSSTGYLRRSRRRLPRPGSDGDGGFHTGPPDRRSDCYTPNGHIISDLAKRKPVASRERGCKCLAELLLKGPKASRWPNGGGRGVVAGSASPPSRAE